jgi:molybdopterin-guanine dinucleotide biosynthesis protein B
MTIDCDVPLIGICAYSGTGKTTLLAKLVPLLKGRGLRLALVKHAHHSFDIDRPGKDSHTLRKAGADQVLVASRQRVAVIAERPGVACEPGLAEILPFLDTRNLDLVVVEGFKREPIPKIELYRPSLARPMIHAEDPQVLAVASDAPFRLARDVPRLDLNRPAEILEFVLDWYRRQPYLLHEPER